MAQPVIKIKRGSNAPSTGSLQAGEFAMDQTNRNLYLAIQSGGSTENVIVAGDGTFATKSYVTTALSALGSVFNYVQTLNGGTITSPYDLSSLSQKDPGDYYKVAASGYFVLGANPAFFANAGDGLVFNTASGIDKIDNTDSSVAGTTDEIAVTGSTDTGFTVSLAQTIKDSITGKLSQASNLSDLNNVSTARTNLGLGDLAVQNKNAVTLTGGTIDGITIGATSATSGKFTTIESTGNATLSGDLNGSATSKLNDFIIDGGVY